MGVLHLLIKNMCSEALRHSHRWCSLNAGTSRCPLLEDWDCDFSSVGPQCTIQCWCRAGTWKILGNDNVRLKKMFMSPYAEFVESCFLFHIFQAKC